MDAGGDRARARPDARARAPARGPGAVPARGAARARGPGCLTTPPLVGLRPEGPLVGRIVRVEPLAERHREGLQAAAADDPDIFRYTNFGFIGFERWFEAALDGDAEVPFAVLVDGREVGSTRFLAIAPEHLRAEIGWTWLQRPAWGSGANVETKTLLLEHAFERCGLRRVEFKTDARNERSRAALEALGASFEGAFRKHMILPSGPRDSAWYAIVDDEWPALKERLRRRLDAKLP